MYILTANMPYLNVKKAKRVRIEHNVLKKVNHRAHKCCAYNYFLAGVLFVDSKDISFS